MPLQQDLFVRMALALLLYYYWLHKDEKNNKRRERSVWVRPIYRKRKAQGQFHHLAKELKLEGDGDFKEYIRMTKSQYDTLLELVKPKIEKKTTFFREPISASERLLVTLRFLATGDDYTSLRYAFRIHNSTISKIVPETCTAIWECLQPIVLPEPTKTKFEEVANEFKAKWHFPNCVGAIDGKHVVIRAPANYASMYFNYKKSFSIVLMAVADANYNFLMVCIGSYGRHSDEGIFSHSSFGQKIFDGTLDLPADQPLAPGSKSMPHVFVGDEAFPLLQNLMKPFPGRHLSTCRAIFNYRLSKARRVVENAFGIMSARFRVFRKPINLKPENVDSVIKACVCLHNYLRQDVVVVASHTEIGIDPGEHESGALRRLNGVGRCAKEEIEHICNDFVEYFTSSAGELPGQAEYVNRTS